MPYKRIQGTESIEYIVFIKIPNGSEHEMPSCVKLRKIFGLPTENCSETCLQISRVYKFGNSFIQFLRSLQVAKVAGIKKVYYPRSLLELNESFEVDGVEYEMFDSVRPKNCFVSDYFGIHPRIPRTEFEINESFKSFFQNRFDRINIPDDVLVLHIRSGDIFRRNINRNYGQPPCGFYREVIRNFGNWSKVILLSQDTANPCVNVLTNEFKIKFNKNSLRNDISVLLNAPNVAFGRGSFGLPIMLLSSKIKNLFLFNQSSSRIFSHYNCIPTDEYFNSVIRNWRKKDFQLNFMLNSSCRNWEFVKKGPQNTKGYIHERYI